MAEYTLFPARVVTPEGVTFEGEVSEIELTSVSGGLGILARRAPIVADLALGHVRVHLDDGSQRSWASGEGFVQASESTATVIVEEAILVDEIDTSAAEEYVRTGNETITRLERERGDINLLAPDDPNRAEVVSARRRVAWGEHLLRMRTE